MSRSSIAVFGATGRTGRFGVAEFLRRGLSPIAIARNSVRLADAGFSPHEITCRVASLDADGNLDRMLNGAHAVINCAGPFLDTASTVASAALRTGVHYLDVTAEQASAKATLDEFSAAASTAGIVVLPAMGFFGGFADLLATAAMSDWNTADAIEIMIGLDGWHPTRGTRRTGERNTAPRMVVTRGELAPLTSTSELNWTFNGPSARRL